MTIDSRSAAALARSAVVIVGPLDAIELLAPGLLLDCWPEKDGGGGGGINSESDVVTGRCISRTSTSAEMKKGTYLGKKYRH